MPYVLPLCLQFFPLCLISCHYAFSSPPLCLATMPSAMPYILPLCLMSCHCAFSYALYLATVPWLLHQEPSQKFFMIIIWSCQSCPYAFNKSWGESCPAFLGPHLTLISGCDWSSGHAPSPWLRVCVCVCVCVNNSKFS